MAFKGDISVVALNSLSGFSADDTFRIYDSGILTKGGVNCQHGDFVYWTGTRWQKKDERFALESEVGAIGDIIPSDASSDNKLATQADITALGKPLVWQGDATVSTLNGTITGLTNGWTYTLTDSGILNDGTLSVVSGDEVAWTGSAWFKIGGDNVEIISVSSSSAFPTNTILAVIQSGKIPVLRYSYTGTDTVRYFWYAQKASNAAYIFTCSDGVDVLTITYVVGSDIWTGPTTTHVSLASAVKAESNIESGVLEVDGANCRTRITLTTISALTINTSSVVPNFAVEIDNTGNTNDVTLTVTSGDETLKYSEAAGNSIESGKFYQLTCVGSCWTLAEFVAPAP